MGPLSLFFYQIYLLIKRTKKHAIFTFQHVLFVKSIPANNVTMYIYLSIYVCLSIYIVR